LDAPAGKAIDGGEVIGIEAMSHPEPCRYAAEREECAAT